MSLDQFFMTPVRSPFALDVDASSLRTAAREMRRMAAEIDRRGGSVRATPDEIGDGWTGRAARATKKEVTSLGRHLDRFVTRLDASREAVIALANTYAEATREVRELNTRWDAASDAYDAALETAAQRHAEDAPPGINPAFTRSGDPEYTRAVEAATTTCRAAHGRLDDCFETLLSDLRRATRTCAAALRDEVPLPVEPDAVSVYRGTGAVVFALEQPKFTEDMPLSRELDRRWPPRPDVSEVDDEFTLSATDRRVLAADLSGVTAEAMAGTLEKWAEKARAQQRVAWQEYRAQGGSGTPDGRAAHRRAAAFSRQQSNFLTEAKFFNGYAKKVPLVGHGLTGYTAYTEIRDGEDPGYVVRKTAVSTGAGAAAGAATATAGAALVSVLYVGTAPVSVPVTIGVLAVGASVVAGKAAEDWFTRRFGGARRQKKDS